MYSEEGPSIIWRIVKFRSGMPMSKRLREERQSVNLDIKMAAEKSGISRAQIVALEEDNTRVFSSKLVYHMTEKKLMKFYDNERLRKSKGSDSIPSFLRSRIS